MSILQLDFGNLDSDIVTRPLIIKISEPSHRNDKRRDNCNCDWFHDGILRFEIFSTASLIPAMRDPVTRSRPQHGGRWSQSSGSRRLSGGLFKIAHRATLAAKTLMIIKSLLFRYRRPCQWRSTPLRALSYVDAPGWQEFL